MKKLVSCNCALLHWLSKDSCWHEGKISNPDWMPFFTSKAMGDVILPIAKNNPAVDFLALCGHTHSSSIYQPFLHEW